MTGTHFCIPSLMSEADEAAEEEFKARLDAEMSIEMEDSRLRPFGYIRGSYWGTCSDCGTEMVDVDRRCEVCIDCAEQRYEESLLDDYGNPLDGSEMPYCVHPDCGCPEPRLCMASNGFGVTY